MADVHSKKIRSYNMSRIKNKDTKPEMIVRQFLFSKGYRYRLHDNRLPGKPDMVFPKYRKVVFVHGCYWHGHDNCKYYSPPKTKTDWWIEKIRENKKRDEMNIDKLKKMGWTSILIWECQLKPDKKKATMNLLMEKLLQTCE